MTLARIPGKHIMQVTGHKTLAMVDRYNITVEQDTHETLIQTQAYLQRQHAARHGQNTDNLAQEE